MLLLLKITLLNYDHTLLNLTQGNLRCSRVSVTHQYKDMEHTGRGARPDRNTGAATLQVLSESVCASLTFTDGIERLLTDTIYAFKLI